MYTGKSCTEFNIRTGIPPCSFLFAGFRRISTEESSTLSSSILSQAGTSKPHFKIGFLGFCDLVVHCASFHKHLTETQNLPFL